MKESVISSRRKSSINTYWKAKLPDTNVHTEFEENANDALLNSDSGFKILTTDRDTLSNVLLTHNTPENRNVLAKEILNAFKVYYISEGKEGISPPSKIKNVIFDFFEKQRELAEICTKLPETLLKTNIGLLWKQGYQVEIARISQLRIELPDIENSILENYLNRPEIFEYYAHAFTNKKTNLSLGYLTALVYAKIKNIHLYIWEKKENNNLELLKYHKANAASSQNKIIHILHLRDYTYFHTLNPIVIEHPKHNPFDKLDQDIKSMIFEYLEDEDVASMSLVCSSFANFNESYECPRRLEKKYNVTIFTSSEELGIRSKIKRFKKLLNSTEIEKDDPDTAKEFIEKLNKIFYKLPPKSGPKFFIDSEVVHVYEEKDKKMAKRLDKFFMYLISCEQTEALNAYEHLFNKHYFCEENLREHFQYAIYNRKEKVTKLYLSQKSERIYRKVLGDPDIPPFITSLLINALIEASKRLLIAERDSSDAKTIGKKIQSVLGLLIILKYTRDYDYADKIDSSSRYYFADEYIKTIVDIAIQYSLELTGQDLQGFEKFYNGVLYNEPSDTSMQIAFSSE